MPDELADLVKRYVKEALAEDFHEMQREGEELGFLPPFWPVPRREWLRYYRDVGERFERNLTSLDLSVSRLASFVARPEDWTPRCSETDKIASLQREVGEVKSSVQQTARLLASPTPRGAGGTLTSAFTRRAAPAADAGVMRLCGGADRA